MGVYEDLLAMKAEKGKLNIADLSLEDLKSMSIDQNIPDSINLWLTG